MSTPTMQGPPYYFAAGDTVRLNGWLSGCTMLVKEHVRDGYFRLAFANGNTAPGFYHEGLMERLA